MAIILNGNVMMVHDVPLKINWAMKRKSHLNATKEWLSCMLEIRRIINSFYSKKIRKMEWKDILDLFSGPDNTKKTPTYIDSTFRLGGPYISGSSPKTFFYNINYNLFSHFYNRLTIQNESAYNIRVILQSLMKDQLSAIEVFIKYEKSFSRYIRRYFKISQEFNHIQENVTEKTRW